MSVTSNKVLIVIVQVIMSQRTQWYQMAPSMFGKQTGQLTENTVQILGVNFQVTG